MKKLLTAMFALVLLAGCKAPADESSAVTTGSTAAPTSPTAAQSATDQSSSETSLTAAQPEDSSPSVETPAPDSDYAVTVNGSHVAKDYKDNPALVVDLTFTNNSEKATSYMFATRTKAFQDGIELEDALFIGDDDYDAANSMKDIKPGKSIDVQEAYVLDGDADVEIEVTELFTVKDVLLASATISVK